MEEKLKILIVDDNPGCLFALSKIISGLGFETLEASSGEEACEVLDTSFYAVVTDMKMADNGLTGIHVARATKEVNKETLVVLCSGSESENPDPKVIDRFILKPIGLSNLVTALSALSI